MTVADRLAALRQAYDLPPASVEQLALLLTLVAESPISLSTVRDPERAVDVHVADSLLGLHVPAIRVAPRIADLGSGAGFPGLVLAAALPDACVTLVESVGKKAAFLEAAGERMGLSNVEVVASRVEEWPAGLDSQTAVTARALAPLTTLVEYAAPILRPSGVLVAWKGPAVAPEHADGAVAASRLGMSPPARWSLPSDGGPSTGDRGTILYVSSKVSPTPVGYPRRPGMARKRPIQAST